MKARKGAVIVKVTVEESTGKVISSSSQVGKGIVISVSPEVTDLVEGQKVIFTEGIGKEFRDNGERYIIFNGLTQDIPIKYEHK